MSGVASGASAAGLAVAFASSGVYFLGIAFFKVAASRMQRLLGTHVVHTAAQIITSRIWLLGALVMGLGVGLQLVALSALPLPIAEPVFVAGLIFLIAIAFGYFEERLSGGEWCCLLLMAAASMMVAGSVAGSRALGPSLPSPLMLAAVVVPSLVLPVALLSAGDLRSVGQHARPLNGVAYGISAGTLIGTAELAVKGLSELRADAGSAPATVYPYLFVAAGGLGAAQLQIALQRCRMITVVFVATVIAKTYLLVAATLLFGGGRYRDHVSVPLLTAGLMLIGLAVTTVPRHDTSAAAPPT
jgi:drug/metabolite transporter (DMT)-like permease